MHHYLHPALRAPPAHHDPLFPPDGQASVPGFFRLVKHRSGLRRRHAEKGKHP